MNNLVWIGAVVLGLSVSQAAAEDLKKWGDAGTWQVFVDAGVGNGCLIERMFDDGSRLRMGDLPDRDGNFLSVVNKQWTGIDEVETVIVHFDLDGVVFGGDVDYVIDGDWRGGFAFFNNPALFAEFARKNTMTITGPANEPVSYSLKGTSNALKSLEKCREEQQG